MPVRSGAGLLAAVVSCLWLAGAGTADAADKIQLKIGTVTIRDTVHQWALDFEKNVEKRAGDRIDVRVFPAGQLGSIARQIEGVQLGTQEMFLAPPDFFVGLDKRFMVTSAPGLFEGLEHGHRAVHDPEFMKTLYTLGEPKGITGIGIYAGDLAHYATRFEVDDLDDFKGRKIRVFASEVEREVLRRMGATAAPMPLLETLPALQRGVLDGVKSGISIFVTLKYWSAAKYVTPTNESVIMVMAIAGKKWFDGLPADLQGVVLEAGAETDEELLAFSKDFLAGNYKKWVDNGGTLVKLPPGEKAGLMKRLSDVGDFVTKEDPGVAEMYRLMKEAAARTRP